MPMPESAVAGIEDSVIRLLAYCKDNDWAGFDPYDALNSRVFARTPFSRSRICRIALTQLLKRLPFNVRPLLDVSRERNPKALALFISALLKLSRCGIGDSSELVDDLIDKLVTSRTPNTPYWCWGYSFPWQTRTVLVPRGSANLVCTTFVANGLLDAYDATGKPYLLEMAASAASYIAHELYWESDSEAGFSYPLAGMRSRVHNANFLAAAVLYRVHRHSRDTTLLGPADTATRYSLSKQKGDGSWPYGEAPTQSWVDNFHTGYNLCALRAIGAETGRGEIEPAVHRGFTFYRERFFTDAGIPKYFDNRTYPIDVHCVAQSIITLIELRELIGGNTDLAHTILDWAAAHLQDERGYFYYQVLPAYTNRMSYMRWSQAWMLLALSTLLESAQGGDRHSNSPLSFRTRIGRS